MTPTEDIDKICAILDKLTLDALLLIEEEIQTKLNIEDAMSSGETNLAKARYIMGQNKVSAIQLPTENSPEFTAPVKVYTSQDEKLYGESYEIHLTEKTDNVHNPIKWFGILVPQTVTLAQKMFQQALQWAVKAVNIQNELNQTMDKINNLKEIKSQMLLNETSTNN